MIFLIDWKHKITGRQFFTQGGKVSHKGLSKAIKKFNRQWKHDVDTNPNNWALHSIRYLPDELKPKLISSKRIRGTKL